MKKRLSVNLKQMPQSGKVSGFFSVDQGERHSLLIWADILTTRSHKNVKDSWLAVDIIKTITVAETAFRVQEEGEGSKPMVLIWKSSSLGATQDFQNNVRHCSTSLL